MLEKSWSQLKSGTDIRGTAVSGLKDDPQTLTDEVIKKVSAGFAFWLKNKLIKEFRELSISVGHDSRITSEHISSIVINALTNMGITVKNCSLSSTPAMFMTTVDLGCDGAIQITASHHPYQKNGLKFFTKVGGLDDANIDEVLLYAQDSADFVAYNIGEAEEINYMNTYAANLREMICKEVNADNYSRPLTGLKIVVDAGNGVGGFYATKVLAPLGADIEGSQFLEPDGMFPNHIPNPENEAAMQAICDAVIENKADLGVIFDTDVDRAACVDSDGSAINRNRLIALVSAIVLEENPGGTIVTDSIISSGLSEFIAQLGGVCRRFKRGYKNVINESMRLNLEGTLSPLAIETSGHAALSENHFLDDGAYLITKIIIKMAQLNKEGKKLGDLIATLDEPLESKEFRLKILTDDFKTYGNQIILDLSKYAMLQSEWEIAPDNHEGIRVSFENKTTKGWFLLRLSVHDPILPLNIESDFTGGVMHTASMLYSFLKQYDKLDLSELKKFLI